MTIATQISSNNSILFFNFFSRKPSSINSHRVSLLQSPHIVHIAALNCLTDDNIYCLENNLNVLHNYQKDTILQKTRMLRQNPDSGFNDHWMPGWPKVEQPTTHSLQIFASKLTFSFMFILNFCNKSE